MTKQDMLRHAQDLLQYSCLVGSSGLYNGKAGMSLSLFEVARYLNNDDLEEKAFELFQESLLTNIEDIGFENGLSGIGFVFIKLIRDEYIEANFEDFFGTQYEYILRVLNTRKHETTFMLQSFSIVLFLSQLKHLKSDARIDHFIYLLFDEMERFLSIQLFFFECINNKINQMEVLQAFSFYLHYAIESKYSISPSLIDTYVTLYRKDCIFSSFRVGYLLSKTNINNNNINCVANKNKMYALRNLTPSLMTIRELLDLMTMLRTDSNEWLNSIENRQLLNKDELSLEKHLLSSFASGCPHVGYGFGLARFLSYCSGHFSLI